MFLYKTKLMCGVINIKNTLYPALLKNIYDPPKKLFYKGNIHGFTFDKCLSVVGSRKMTHYGVQAVSDIVSKAAKAGITIVSGFMYGIDAEAHKAALRVLGKTIAVMPCGIDHIHPSVNTEIYWQIVESGGLILSEYPGTELPQLWTYPRRNRIVAGLSAATLVIEAAEKSGSLITAELALQSGRDVFAIPGNIYAPTSKGTNNLIRDGASAVTCAQDIFDYYGLSQPPVSYSSLDSSEKLIISIVSKTPLGLDELSRAVGLPIKDLSSLITKLLLEEILLEKDGIYYVS